MLFKNIIFFFCERSSSYEINYGMILVFLFTAGDAILTLWKVKHFKTMKSTVVHVLQCAMNIQEKCGKYKTSVGVTLRVKIGRFIVFSIIHFHKHFLYI